MNNHRKYFGLPKRVANMEIIKTPEQITVRKLVSLGGGGYCLSLNKKFHDEDEFIEWLQGECDE